MSDWLYVLDIPVAVLLSASADVPHIAIGMDAFLVVHCVRVTKVERQATANCGPHGAVRGLAVAVPEHRPRLPRPLHPHHASNWCWQS